MTKAVPTKTSSTGLMKKLSKNSTQVKWLLLLLAAAICIIIFIYLPPSGVPWITKDFSTDSGISCCLKNRKVTLRNSDGSIFWNSNYTLHVQDAFITDIDKNGDDELILLVWKRGKYGNHRPFWVLTDDPDYSQHIFIYDISNSYMVSQKWFASDIGCIVNRMKLMEQDPSILLLEESTGSNSLWHWSSFGLKSMDNEVKFIAFGDNIIHKRIYEYAYAKEGGSFDFLYDAFRDEIENADISALQAETVLVDKESAVSGYPSFGSPIAVGEAIKNAGFDIAVCANNHSLDRGIYGIDTITRFYEQNGIICTGIQNSADTEYVPYETISRNGIKFALFNYTYGTNGNDARQKYPYAVHYLPESDNDKRSFVEEIKNARSETDFIIVFVHWGDEYSTEISKAQKEYAGLLAEAGADVIIGTHPHVVQDTELIDRPDGGQMLVYYSLGNFRADQKQDTATQIGAEAVFFVEHTYDGVALKSWDIKSVDAGW